MPLGRDVCFASDVRFAREEAEHITSLCDEVAIHHYGEDITSLRLAATSLITDVAELGSQSHFVGRGFTLAVFVFPLFREVRPSPTNKSC